MFIEAASHDFLQAGSYLVIGAAAAAALHVLVPTWVFEHLAGHLLLGVVTMALLAVVLALCSEADAFVAASITMLPLLPRLVFLVVGPAVDVKLIAMQAGMFGRKFALRFAPDDIRGGHRGGHPRGIGVARERAMKTRNRKHGAALDGCEHRDDYHHRRLHALRQALAAAVAGRGSRVAHRAGADRDDPRHPPRWPDTITGTRTDTKHRSAIVWLLAVPIVLLIFVVPPALSARAVGPTAIAASTDASRHPFPPLPAGRAPTVSLPEVLMRIATDSSDTLHGRLITITGFTVKEGRPHRPGPHRHQIRRAADAQLASIHLSGRAAAVISTYPDNTWLSVEGTIPDGTTPHRHIVGSRDAGEPRRHPSTRPEPRTVSDSAK